MSRHRFFVETPMPDAGEVARIALSDSDAHHAASVLRLRAGEQIVVVEPGGRTRAVEVLAVGPGEVLSGRAVQDLSATPEPRITLVQGILKGSLMDDVVQHAVELGAERIVPVLMERTIVRLDPAKSAARVSRWQKIAEGAATQSQRSRLPLVAPVLDLSEVLGVVADSDLVVVLWEEAGATSLSDVLSEAGIAPGCSEARVGPTCSEARVTLVIGPEGGLSAEEVAMLADGGAIVATLGPAILRAETASLAAITIVALALGAFEPSGEV